VKSALHERFAETHRAMAMEKAEKAERKAAQAHKLLEIRAYEDALWVIGEAEDWLHSARLNIFRTRAS
jgi:hypothetical protein